MPCRSSVTVHASSLRSLFNAVKHFVVLILPYHTLLFKAAGPQFRYFLNACAFIAFCCLCSLYSLTKNHFTNRPLHAIFQAVDGIPFNNGNFTMYKRDIILTAVRICAYRNERDMRSWKQSPVRCFAACILIYLIVHPLCLYGFTKADFLTA